MRLNRRVGVTVLLLVMSAAAVVVMSPSGSTVTGQVAVESNGGSAPGTAGLRVYLDPETGDVAANVDANAAAELDAALQNALRYDDDGLEFVTHPNGAVSVNLQERYQSASVVHLDENGEVVVCTDNVAGVKQAPGRPASDPTTWEVK